ncbi:MAG: hypothetical protein IKY79_01455 [Bacteroidales bacterium]|nr:hypothetical protein [Bacteroidales bacterium]
MKKIVLIFLVACAIVFNIHAQNKINGHEYVDLGLPSGTKWATRNVGASLESIRGDYYAWGEIKDTYFYTNSSRTYHGKVDMTAQQKNCCTYGKRISNISGNVKYDVARANWGGSWRMPTKEEMTELVIKCNWTWTTQIEKGLFKNFETKVPGYKVTGPNGNSIFLPVGGCSPDDWGDCRPDMGYYWSSTPLENDNYRAYYLSFGSSGYGVNDFMRPEGLLIRPVSD